MDLLVCDFVSIGLYFVTLLSLFVLIITHQRKKLNFFRDMGVKCEPTWPILGAFPELLRQGILEHDIYAIRKYGSVHGSFLGNMPNLVVADPDFIQEILVRQYNNFPYRMKALYISPWWENGVVIASGEHWRYLRSLISPAFSTSKLKQMQPKIIASLNNMNLYFQQRCKYDNTVTLDLRRAFSSVTMDIICSTSFGVEANTIHVIENEFSRHAKIVSTLNIESNPFNALPLIIPSIKKIFEVFDLDYVNKNSLNYIKGVVRSMIEARRANDNKNLLKDTLQNFMDAHRSPQENTKQTYDDLDSNLCEELSSADKNVSDLQTKVSNRDAKDYQFYKQKGLSDDELIANSIIVLMAGHDTTATTVTWMSYLLAVNQDIQRKVFEEINAVIGSADPTYSDLQKLEYLDWFLSETLRLYPAANRTGRDAACDTVVNGLKIPKGTCVTVPIHALHRMPEYWDEPEKCIPERFSLENRNTINPYVYIPYGVGPRACVGVRMAQMLCKIIMVKFLQNFRLETSDKTEFPPVLEKSLLTKPLNGMHLKIIRRT